MQQTITPAAVAPLFVRAGQSRRSYRYLGEGITGDCLLTASDTGGAFSLFDIACAPGAFVPPHVHANEDEIFYVLEGRFSLQVGEQVIVAGPGACLHGKKGVTHSPKNIGDTPGRALVLATPGGFERFFDALNEMGGLPVDPTPENLAKAFDLLALHGMQPGAPADPSRPVEVAALNTGAFVNLGNHRGYTLTPSAETDDQLLFLDMDVDCGGGVPTHIHAHEDETFYVLSGRVAIEVDGRTVEACPGDTVFAPRGLPHSWFCIGDKPARVLLVVSPGGNFEAFARQMSEIFTTSSETDPLAQCISLAVCHGIEMIPPGK